PLPAPALHLQEGRPGYDPRPRRKDCDRHLRQGDSDLRADPAEDLRLAPSGLVVCAQPRLAQYRPGEHYAEVGVHALPSVLEEHPGCNVLIVGTGCGGLCAAIQLSQGGESDVILLERANRVGGTWRDNHYPGCACDVPSMLYSLSFAQNADWSRV